MRPVSFELRAARPGDAEAVAYVHHTSWVETYSHMLPASHWETDTIVAREERWQRNLAQSTAFQTTLAEVEGRIVGFATVGAAHRQHGLGDARDLQLAGLYVLANRHGSGIGQALLDAVIPPGTPAQLYVAKGNARAEAFYRRNGFEPDGVEILDDRFDLTEIRMIR